jgi:hypothetical protein
MKTTVTIFASHPVAPSPYQYTVQFYTSLAILAYGEEAITIEKLGSHRLKHVPTV